MTKAVSRMRQVLLAALVALGTCACGAKNPKPPAQASSAEKQVEPDVMDRANFLMGQGGMAFSEKDYQTAFDHYLEAAALLDSHEGLSVEQAEAHFQTAEMAVELKDSDMALEHYERAAEIYLRFPGKTRVRAAIALANAGVIHKEKHNEDKARSSWERALEIYDEVPAKQRNQGNIQMIQQNLRDLEAGY